MRRHREMGKLRVWKSLWAVVVALAVIGAAPQQGPTPIDDVKLDREVDFNKDIFPIFKTNCLACHNASDAEGEVILETPETIRKGGEEGPIVVAGKAMESSLLKVVSRRAKPYMPPRKNKVGAKPLTSRELGLLKLWIDQGAKGTGVSAIPAPTLKAGPGSWNPIYAVALDAEGRTIAAGRAGRLYIYDLPTRRLTAQPVDPALSALLSKGAPGLAHTDAVNSMAFSPDGTILATGGYRAIKLWKKSLPTKTAKVDLGDAKVLAISPDGKRLAAAKGKDIRVLDLSNGKTVSTLKGHGGDVASVRFSADGSKVLSGAADKTARSWNAADGKAIGVQKTPQPVTAVAWLADDKQIATGEKDNVIRVWNAPAPAKPAKKEEKKDGDKKKEEKKPEAPKPIKELKGHSGEIRTLALHPGNPKQLLSGSLDSRLRQWDLEKGSQVREFNHGTAVLAVGSSTDGKRFVSVGGNKTAKIWNGENGQQIAELSTDGRAKRTDQQAQAFLGFVNNEVKYREQVVKNSEDAKKKEEAEVKKATDALPAAEKAVTDARTNLDKAIRDRKGVDDRFALAMKDVEFSKARAEAAAQALGRTANDGTLKEFQAAKAEADKAVAAMAKAVEEAKKKTDAATKAMNDAKAKNDAAKKKADADKKAADKALADAQKAIDAAKMKADAATKPMTDAKAKQDGAVNAFNQAKAKVDQAAEAVKGAGDDAAKKKAAETAKKTADEALKKAEAAKTAAEAAFKKAAQDKQNADQALAAATKNRDEAKAKGDAAAKALADANAAADLQKATAAKAAADRESARVNGELRFLTIKRDAAGKMLAFADTGVKFLKATTDKTAADKAMAAMEKAVQDGQNKVNTLAQTVNTAKGKMDGAVNAFNQAKAKADQAAAAVKGAGDDAAKKKAAEAAKKTADEALKAATTAKTATEAAFKKAGADKQNADKALAEATKKRDEQRNKVNQSNQALQQAKAAGDNAKRTLEQEKGQADQAARNAESVRQREQRNAENAKRNENEKSTAWDVAKLNLQSSKRRVEKAHEGVKNATQTIAESKSRLAKEKEHQKKVDADRKKTAEAVGKARMDLRTGAVSPDGAVFVAGASNGTLYTFGTAAGRESIVLGGHGKDVAAARFLADGTLVSVAADGSVRTGAVSPAWKLERVIKADGAKLPRDRIVSLTFSPDGKLLASGGGTPSRQGELLIWNVADGALVREIADAHSDTVYDVNFSRDGSMLASCAADKFAKVWNVADGKRLNSFEGHTYHVLGVGWNRTGRSLATAGADNVIKVWDRTTGKQKRTIQGFAKQVTAVRYLGYGETFAVAAGGTQVRTVGENGRTVRNFDTQGAFMYAVSVSRDGQVLAGGGLDSVLRVWQTRDGKSLATFAPPSSK